MPDTSTNVPSLWNDSLGRAGTRSAQVLLIAALAAAVLWALGRVPLVVIPVLIALILASAIGPLVRKLTGHGWPQGAATAAAFVGILAIFGAVITGTVLLVRAQAAELAAKSVTAIDQLHTFLNTGPVPVSDAQIGAAQEFVRTFLTSGTFGAQALTGARTVGEILAGGALMAVTLFFLLLDGEKIRTFAIGFLPERHRVKARRAADHGTIVLGSYVRGTAIVAAVDGFVIGIALAILQVPLALPLAVFIFLGGFIPIVGATAAGVLATGIALVSNGPVTALIVLAVVVGVNQLEGHFLQPVVMGKAMSIHGLAILLALAAGTMLAGIIGALLSVPLTALAWTVVKVWSGRDTAPEAPAPVLELEPAMATV